mgnify:CR=1 FL=1
MQPLEPGDYYSKSDSVLPSVTSAGLWRDRDEFKFVPLISWFPIFSFKKLAQTSFTRLTFTGLTPFYLGEHVNFDDTKELRMIVVTDIHSAIENCVALQTKVSGALFIHTYNPHTPKMECMSFLFIPVKNMDFVGFANATS